MTAKQTLVMLFAAVLFLSVSLAASVRADVYTVSAIEIEAEASSAFEAQRQALQDGQTRAAQLLIERMTLAEDRFEAGMEPIDSETAAGLIAGIQISDEQRTATLYRARLSVSFDPRALRTFFNMRGLAYVESQGDPVLVVPVFDSESGPQIFDNDWYSAWTDGGFENALTPFIVVDDQFDAFDTSDILRRNETVLREMAEHYGVSNIAIALGLQQGDIIRAGGELITFEPPAAGGLDALLESDFNGIDPIEPQMSSAALQAVTANDFLTAAQRIVEQSEDVWKREAVVRSTQTGTISVTVFYRNFRQWRSLQGILAGASLVQTARLDAISPSGATMTVTHRGSIDQVRAELAARGAVLDSDSELGWTVQAR